MGGVPLEQLGPFTPPSPRVPHVHWDNWDQWTQTHMYVTCWTIGLSHFHARGLEHEENILVLSSSCSEGDGSAHSCSAAPHPPRCRIPPCAHARLYFCSRVLRFYYLLHTHSSVDSSQGLPVLSCLFTPTLFTTLRSWEHVCASFS